ncbi:MULTISPECIES: hypothetical protein [Aureibaculum]|uniref:hypothetical protein n=1 Tax=Aureibaculum TaxID=2706948 RepID=UPI001E63A914|nr:MULTISPECIES: hypothetical protein [Aureibaculum]
MQPLIKNRMNKLKIKNILKLTAVLLLFSLDSYSQSTITPEIQQTVIKNGVGLGSVIAVTVSWERNKSILWAILHGVFSWIYVIYYAVSR